MKVYPVQRRLCLDHDEQHEAVDEIISVRKTLQGAMEFVAKRIGKTLVWEFHGAHGPVWCAADSFRINNGPLIRNEYAITEHELED